MALAHLESSWLTLSKASELLGIHPTTLRAWVDAGMVHAFLTPGGHRRFKESELRAFLESRRANLSPRGAEPIPEQAIAQVRNQLRHMDVARHTWYRRLSDDEKNRHRTTGAQLLRLLLSYVSRQDNPEQFLAQARQVAQEYGRNFAAADSSVSELAQAFLFFRRMIVNAAYSPTANRVMNDEEGMRLLERINEFMDELLIATLDAFDRASSHPLSRDALVKAVNQPRKTLRKPPHAAKY
jgi:excisionase family DNA binding protein